MKALNFFPLILLLTVLISPSLMAEMLSDNYSPLGDNSSPALYSPCWNDDILVTNQCEINTHYNYQIDHDLNANLYTAVQSSHPGNDTIFIFKSTDKGYTWQVIREIYRPSSDPHSFLAFDFKVNKVQSNPDIYLILSDSSHSIDSTRLWLANIPGGGGSINWSQIPIPSNYFGHPVIKLSMDITHKTSPNIFASFIHYGSTKDPGIWISSYSTDLGNTWSPTLHANGPVLGTSCSCADDSTYYCVCVLEGNTHRVCLFQLDLNHHYDIYWVSNSNDIYRTNCHVSSTKETFPNNKVTVVYQQETGTSSRVYYNHSSDGGVNWNGPGFIPFIGDNRASNPNIRYSQGNHGVVICNAGDNDSVMAAVISNGNIYSEVTINDHPPSGILPPLALPVYISPINGRVVVYHQHNSNNIWFDRWNYTLSAEEQINQSPNLPIFKLIKQDNYIELKFSLSSSTRVNINIFDITGRNIRSFDNSYHPGSHQLIWDLKDDYGLEVTSGNYLVRFSNQFTVETKALQLF